MNVKGSKDKIKLTCPSGIQEYSQFMGGVGVDCLSKFRFYLRVFFNFLDIAVVNSKIVYNKIESAPSLSSLDFRYSIAQTMIQKFSSRKRAVPLSRRLKRLRGPSFDIVDHLPDFAPSQIRCAFCSSKNVESRTCVRCITCNIALCLQKDRKCFQQYHTKQWFIVTFLKYNFTYISDIIIFNMIIHEYLHCNLFHAFLSKTPCNQNKCH